jgi:hypothetical protein
VKSYSAASYPLRLLLDQSQIPRFQHGVHGIVHAQLFKRYRRVRFDRGDFQARFRDDHGV